MILRCSGLRDHLRCFRVRQPRKLPRDRKSSVSVEIYVEATLRDAGARRFLQSATMRDHSYTPLTNIFKSLNDFNQLDNQPEERKEKKKKLVSPEAGLLEREKIFAVILLLSDEADRPPWTPFYLFFKMNVQLC